MAHIVCITHGMAGLLYSSFELLRRLEAAGHRITYASTADVEAAVKAQGFAYRQLPLNTTSQVLARDRTKGRLVQLCSIPQRRQLMVEAMGVTQFPSMLRELKPDLLLVDLEMHPHIVSAAPLGITIALLSPWMSIWKRPGMPPLHKEIIPEVGWRGRRFGLELVWLRFRLRKLRKRWRQWRDSVGIDWVSVMRQHARATGFPFRKEVELHHWQIPFSYRSLPVLCLRTWELEFPHEPRPNVFYVGPMVHRQRKDSHPQPEVDSQLKRLISHCRESRASRRLIFCGFSSFVATNRNLLPRLIQAFEQRSDWHLVLGLGNQLDVKELGPMPPNIHAFPWVPQLRVLQHADAAIIHGGINTVEECVHFGVPMLVYCCGINDTPGTTARVVFHGLGVAGDSKNDTTQIILRRLEQLLDDCVIRKNVDRIRERVNKYPNEQYAERVVATLLGKNRK